MRLSFSSYYVYDTGNGCLLCGVNGAIFFLLRRHVGVEIPFSCLFETRRPIPPKWKTPLCSELSGLADRSVCPAVRVAACRFLSLFYASVCLYLLLSPCHPLPTIPPSLLLEICTSVSDFAPAHFPQLARLTSLPCEYLMARR